MFAEAAYADLEIRIGKGQAGGYQVEITLHPGTEFQAHGIGSELLPSIPSASLAEDGVRLFQVLVCHARCFPTADVVC